MIQYFHWDGSFQLVTWCVDQDMKLGRGENISDDTLDNGIVEFILSATWDEN